MQQFVKDHNISGGAEGLETYWLERFGQMADKAFPLKTRVFWTDESRITTLSRAVRSLKQLATCLPGVKDVSGLKVLTPVTECCRRRAAAYAERLWSPRDAVTKGGVEAATSIIRWFRCLLNDRGVEAYPSIVSPHEPLPFGLMPCYDQ